MKILIVLAKDPHESFLIKLQTQELISEIKNLLLRRRNTQAMVTALAKGTVEREINSQDLMTVNADLTISRDRVNWSVGSK